jgi:hypothetical protein
MRPRFKAALASREPALASMPMESVRETAMRLPRLLESKVFQPERVTRVPRQFPLLLRALMSRIVS